MIWARLCLNTVASAGTHLARDVTATVHSRSKIQGHSRRGEQPRGVDGRKDHVIGRWTEACLF